MPVLNGCPKFKKSLNLVTLLSLDDPFRRAGLAASTQLDASRRKFFWSFWWNNFNGIEMASRGTGEDKLTWIGSTTITLGSEWLWLKRQSRCFWYHRSAVWIQSSTKFQNEYFTVNSWKDENKDKEAGNGPLKISPLNFLFYFQLRMRGNDETP